jgi:hypothetical protein
MVFEELVQSAIRWPGMPMAVYRKTLPSLRDSTLQEFKTEIDSNLYTWREKDMQSRFINGAFINWRGLDDPQKAKSSEYACIVMEEADEFTLDDFKFLRARVRKKGPWPLRIILVLNPCDEEHWIYKQFVEHRKDYEESGGLMVLHLSSYDNEENLPENYIQNQMAGLTKDEINRYIFGQWGAILRGKPVYVDVLNPNIHLQKWEIRNDMTLLRGWDFGFNHPACSFRLMDSLGRMNCRTAVLGDKEHLDIFARRIKKFTVENFPQMPVQDFGDPRGHDNMPSGKETCFDVLAEIGINAVGERGSREYVEKGIRSVRNNFTTLVGGMPNLSIDPDNTLIRTAYFVKYVRGDDGKALKDGYWEHTCDADRYIDHHLDMCGGKSVKDAIMLSKQRILKRKHQ